MSGSPTAPVLEVSTMAEAVIVSMKDGGRTVPVQVPQV
jgi:hypothetical protein